MFGNISHSALQIESVKVINLLICVTVAGSEQKPIMIPFNLASTCFSIFQSSFGSASSVRGPPSPATQLHPSAGLSQ